MTALVSVHDVSHRFGALCVLDAVSLTISPGSYTVLLGPSGSGKTTLLSILGGFLVQDSGWVTIRGIDCTGMPPAQRPTTTVFQDYALFPHMSVIDNVAFGLRMSGIGKAARRGTARDMLDLVGLGQAAEKKPHQLSGGQRQRVALARALVMEPAVLLLDEPLGALDLKLRRQMQDELKAIQQRVGTAFIHVTHDQEEAMALADHVVVMNQGRIVDQGPPTRVYERPATRFTAMFMGESTILDGKVTRDGMIETSVGRFPAPLAEPGADLHVAIRPEHVHLDGPLTSTVRDVVYQGSFKRVTLNVDAAPGIPLLARLPPGAAVEVGDRVSLGIDADRVTVLVD